MTLLRPTLLVVLQLSALSCTLLKASPAPSSGFLPDDDKLQEMRQRAPFNAGYVPDHEKLDKLKREYNSFCVLPVSVEPLQATLKAEGFSGDSLEDRLTDAKELGVYFVERLKQTFADKKLPIYTEPLERCLIWEIALVELRPTVIAVNVLATAAGAFVPGAGLTRRLGTGSIALEVVIRDGKSGDVLAQFKDREKDKDALFTARDFQLYSHARASLDDWAEQFAELSATSHKETVEDSLPVTFSPF